MNIQTTDSAVIPGKKSFDFVDTIRCISMIGIVFEHTAVLWGVSYPNIFDTWLQVGTMQLFKFVTIAFFIIGGFLINYKFTEYTAGEYLSRRFKNTIRPWLFWIAVLIVLNLIHRWVIYIKMNDRVFIEHPGAYFIEEFRYILFESSFWFILNFLICISLLLLFKKHIYKIWFGLFWAAVSLLYSFNLYYRWFVTHHSAALFGFVFYLWLGVYLNRYFDQVILIIKKLRWRWVIAINILFFVMACLEIFHLTALGLNDAYNTLRITNILYSLTMFVLLLKIGGLKKLDKLLIPRKTTFGIYLIHYILILRLLPEIFKGSVWNAAEFSVSENILYSILRFLVVYFISFFITLLLLKTRMKWVVGG